MKECTTHHFTCDCREEKIREYLRTQYDELRELSSESLYLLERASPLLRNMRENYEALYGSASLIDLAWQE